MHRKELFQTTQTKFKWLRIEWLFFKCPPSAILFLMDPSQKLIRSFEIPSEPPHQI